MVLVLNRLNQPLPVNLKNGKSLHFLAKESKSISFDDFQSTEIKEKVDKGMLVVLRMDNE